MYVKVSRHHIHTILELLQAIGKGISLKHSLFLMLVHLHWFTSNKSRNVHVKNFSQDSTCTTTTCTTLECDVRTFYYPMSTLLFVKWSPMGDEKQKKISKF